MSPERPGTYTFGTLKPGAESPMSPERPGTYTIGHPGCTAPVEPAPATPSAREAAPARSAQGAPGVYGSSRACPRTYNTGTPGVYGSGKACPGTCNTFTRWFRAATDYLGFGNIAWTTHGLRRGGATELLRRQVSLHDIMIVGRWRTERSCRGAGTEVMAELPRRRMALALAAGED